MVTILGFEINLPAGLEFFSILWVNIVVNIIAWTAITIIINFILLRIIRFITRQLPGDLEDIVFAILRGPLILLILLYGGIQTLFLVNLTPAAKHYVNLLTITVVVIIITHILGRVIKDILVYYGNKWAIKTESKVDDVLIPVLNLFGPVVLVLSAALIILPLWGFNITSVLVGAGVIGLVLGLALQSTLANIFSGLSLLVEAPFRTGDLITLADGRICEVQRVGMRSTQLYSVKEHATVFVPNTTFSTTTLTNITKPTVDQKFSLDFKAPTNVPLETFMEDVRKIALAHPATLARDMNEKVELLKQMLTESREQQTRSNQIPTHNLNEVERVEKVLPKLELEGSLNTTLIQLEEALRNLIRGIIARESKGLTETERQDIFCNYISPVDPALQETVSLAKSWASAVDPWLDHTDHWDLVRLWEFRNSQLQEQWEKVKKAIYHPNDRTEMRLDDLTSELLDWIQREYKIIPEYWKDPTVFVKGINGSEVNLQASYYVDNIRLEHDERANRVQSEITYQIHQLIQKYG